MNPVKLQCNICFSVAEIANPGLQLADRLTTIPLLELDACKHQLCSMCIRKIRKQKKVPCPLCRVDSLHFNVYSVNRNVVDVIKCSAANIVHWNKVNDNFDAASLASVLFEKSLVDDDADDKKDCLQLPDLQSTLQQLQTDIMEHAQHSIRQKLALDELRQANVAMQAKLNSLKKDYISTQCKRIAAEKALKSINKHQSKLIAKNTKLFAENKILVNKNIELIKHKNVLQNEYTALQQKTHNCITNNLITTNVTINLD